jgi:TolB protein
VTVPWSGALAIGCLALVFLGSGAASPSFPGRAGKIAFVSDSNGSNDIVVMDLDGSARESLTAGADEDTDPAWAPDGRRLAFVRNGAQPAIYVIRSDGGGLKRVTVGASPAWSPDGGQIVFSRNLGRSVDLYLVRADGRGLRRLTRTAAVDSEPEWSPDGRLIAFVRSGPAGSSHVFVMRPDGHGARRITTGAVEDLSPTWSPDGRQLAFVRDDEMLGVSRVFVTTVDRHQERPLVGKLALDPAATFESGPSWAPDGKRIVFVRGARLYSDIYVASADGKFLRRVTDNAADQITDRQPSWQRLTPRRKAAIS